jgi:hypothetical protein
LLILELSSTVSIRSGSYHGGCLTPGWGIRWVRIRFGVSGGRKRQSACLQIKAELRMPEYENLAGAKEQIPITAEAAYRAIKGGYSVDTK